MGLRIPTRKQHIVEQLFSGDSGPEGGSPPFESAVAMLQGHLAKISADAAGIVISEYETEDPAAVNGVVVRSQALVTSALDALEVISVLYGDGVDLGSGEPAEGDAAPGDAAPGDAAPDDGAGVVEGEGIADAVVLARMGLRYRLRSLRDLGERATQWERLSVVGSALRTIQKSLSVVDRAMADAEQVPPSLRFYEDAVERSLAARRRYVHLHRVITKELAPSGWEVRRRLRLIGNTIAQVLGHPEAAHLRTGDRAVLMMSHAKVRGWLAVQEDDAVHVAAGLRLWQDLVNTATMFLDVSKREELVQHDARVLGEALHDIACAVDPTARAALLEKLSTMVGRSASLDAVVEAGPDAADMAELRRILEELHRTLVGPAAPVANEHSSVPPDAFI